MNPSSSSPPTEAAAADNATSNSTSESNEKTMSLNIKCSNESKVTVSVLPSITVLDLKSKIAEQLENTPPESQRLIYSGKVLKDNDTLNSYKMGDGHTIHVVRSQLRNTSTTGQTHSNPDTAASTNTGSTPSSNNDATNIGSNAQPPLNPFAIPGMNPFSMFSNMGGGAPGAMGGTSPAGAPGGAIPSFDPNMMSSMMSNPFVQAQMQQMLSNPQLLNSLMGQNPLLSSMNTPEMRSMMQSMMSNPEMMQNMMGMMGGMGGMGTGGLRTTASNNANTGTTPFNAGTNNTTGGIPSMPPLNSFGGMDPSLMQSMLSGFNPQGMSNSNPAAVADSRPPEERYSTQLQQLSEMGFFEPERNIRALQLTGGNVNAAIEWLFSNS